MGNEGGSRSFLPASATEPIKQRNPDEAWTAPLPLGYAVENDPPTRRILRDGRVLAEYPADDTVQERMILLQLLQQGAFNACSLAKAWGLHRNTLGNWGWRYRYFGLDGLVDGRLPARRVVLEEVLREAQQLLREQPRLSETRLGVLLYKRRRVKLPPPTLHWLRAVVFGPKALPLQLNPPTGDGDATEGTTPNEADAEPVTDGPAPAAEQPADVGTKSGPEVVTELEAPASAQAESLPPSSAQGAGGGEGTPSQAGEAEPVTDGPEQLADADTEPEPPVVTELQAHALPQVESLPLPPDTGGAMVRYGGLALVLPFLQQLLDPLEGMLERWWGAMTGYYRPRQLLEAFLLYLLVGYRNPEQTKAAPAQDFGPLLGRTRAPCCATLRARLPALAVRETTEQLQEQLALQYLRLGWVQLGWWLVDGHFSPYFGQQSWAKSWWPQRRMPQRGYIQDWVHDRRGRPLCMHLTQGFECFGDQLALLGQTVGRLLGEAGQPDVPIIVFDRGGYSSNVFTALNAQGVGWVTWLKGAKPLPASAFTQQAEIPGGRDHPTRTVHYACTTHRVEGCNDHVPAIFWHDGDAQHQVALLSNLSHRQPGAWSPPQLITMLSGRWPQENSFKAQVHDLDLDWTCGYAHEPCADTPVPNPRIRAWRRRLGERTAQLRRHMNRPEPTAPKAAARYRRRLGILRGQVTRLQQRIAATPATISYRDTGGAATQQLQPGRGTFFPVLRALAYHLRLQLRDGIAAVFPDYRERDKALRVLLHTPARWVHTPDADWVILQHPSMPRYDRAIARLIDACNTLQPHAPGQPSRPLRFALENRP